MRKLTPLLLITLAAIAIPGYAARGKDQSYITYDDGGAIVKQGDEGREVDARVNFPIYPGDEVTTGQRGRTEIRLADGNIIALDRSTSVRFQSIDDSYDSDSMQSVIELKYGHVAVQRTDDATELLRVDTSNASYAAMDEAVYAIDTDVRGQDRLTVYDGSVEVRTPQRSTRVHTGEEARIDDQGIYDLVKARTGVTDEFERWFARRSERYSSASSRYLDRSLAYSDYDLQENGSWVFVSSYGGYAWRPHVAVGWRPYFNGRWGYGPGGCLTWISYEPWGWVPYHYGRWGYDPLLGWVWLPGYTYAPAWVYWAYGPGYIGWAPAGWYDCYRPYYGWAYRPYARGGFDFGFGFYGRVRLNEVDLRPWTFVNPNHIVSNRIDQAALNTDAIRQRLIRDPNARLATVTGTPARFTRNELKDPAAAVNNIVRRGLVGGTGRGSSGTVADMTPFFRRDPELSSAVRDRVVRSRAAEPVATSGGAPPTGVGAPSGIPTPGTRGTLEGRVGRDGGGSKGDYRPGEATGRVLRDPYGGRNETPATTTNRDNQERSATPRRDRQVTPPARDNNWRNHVDRPAPATPPPATDRPSVDRTPPPATERPSLDRTPPPQTERQRPPQENWRSRSVERGGDRNAVPRDRSSEPQPPRDRGADIPRRIIDRIGGARITGDTPRETARPRDNAPPPTRERSSSPPPERSSSPPPQKENSSPPPSSRSNDSGGHVHRGN